MRSHADRREQLKAIEDAEKSYERVPMSIANQPFNYPSEEPVAPENVAASYAGERADQVRPQALPFMPPGAGLQENPQRPGTYQGYMRNPPPPGQEAM